MCDPCLSALSPVHTSNNFEATRNFVESTFDFVATNGNIVERVSLNFVFSTKSKQIIENVSLFRLCRKDEISFDIVAETGNIVAKNGNNVEATFDIVDRIVKLVAFDNVAGVDGALEVATTMRYTNRRILYFTLL